MRRRVRHVRRPTATALLLPLSALLFATAALALVVIDQEQPDTITEAEATTDPIAATAPELTTTTPEATTTAERLPPQIPLTEPPPPPYDPIAHTNSLAYCWQCPAPAMDAYRTVAAWYGWTAPTIEARALFVERIMAGESAFCWNARAWSHHTALLMPCSKIGQGTRDDVGFGQITNVLRPLTCERAGLCTIADTIATPWSSMLAYVIVLDELGRTPWCYNRNTHVRNGDCATWPG